MTSFATDDELFAQRAEDSVSDAVEAVERLRTETVAELRGRYEYEHPGGHEMDLPSDVGITYFDAEEYAEEFGLTVLPKLESLRAALDALESDLRKLTGED